MDWKPLDALDDGAMTPYYDEGGIVIYHGDCLEILGQLPAADLVVFDPPYNVGKQYASYDDNRTNVAYWRWLITVLAACDADTLESCELVYFPGQVNLSSAFIALERSSWRFKRTLGWHKKEFAGDLWTGGPAMCWEPILWASATDKSFYNKVFGHGGRDFLVVNSTHGNRMEHPCPKPPEVLRWLIGLFAPAEGLVLDPMMGTGTALVEAKHIGRRAVGIEIEERYCEIAVKRLAQGVLDVGA